MFQILSTLPVYEKSAWVFKLNYTEEENKFEWIMKTLISYHYVNKDQHCAILKSPSRNVIMQVLFSAAVTVLAPVQWLLARKSCMHINDDEGQLDQPKKPDNSVLINTIPLTSKIVIHIKDQSLYPITSPMKIFFSTKYSTLICNNTCKSVSKENLLPLLQEHYHSTLRDTKNEQR